MQKVKNEKGFTLVELLAVIVIMAILLLVAIPNISKVRQSSLKKTMRIQEGNVKKAADLYIQDYCTSGLEDTATCPDSYARNIDEDEKYICLSNLTDDDNRYISDVTYNRQSCNGVVVYTKNSKSGLYTDAKVYLFCGSNENGKYAYATDQNINPVAYTKCNIRTSSILHYLQDMEGKLTEVHSNLQEERFLIDDANSEINTPADRERIKKEVLELNNNINAIYDYEYLNTKIFHKDNEVTGEFVIMAVNTAGLNLDSLTFSDYSQDIKIIKEAMDNVKRFRAYIGAKQNSYEVQEEFNACRNKACKVAVANKMIRHLINKIAYGATYDYIFGDFDRELNNIEVQEYFKTLDLFADSLKDNSISKNSIFPNSKDTLTKYNAKVVYFESRDYLKKSGYVGLISDVWQDEISMLQTVQDALSGVNSLESRMREITTMCSAADNTGKASINNEIGLLLAEIERIKSSTEVNGIGSLRDPSYYQYYLLYDVIDEKIKTVNCNNSSSLEILSEYERKMSLNDISINASMKKANKLIDFSSCQDESCEFKAVKSILDEMSSLASKSINATSSKQEEYNIEYTTYFKALDHIAEAKDISKYSTGSLKLNNTNILNKENAKAAKTAITKAIASLK